MTTEDAPTAEVSRLVACRGCGNRVARTVRRCPACGSTDPAADKPAEAQPRPTQPRPSNVDPSRRLAQVVVAGALLVIVILVTVMIVRVWEPRADRAPAAETAPPAVVEATPAVTTPVVVTPEPPIPEPSRSRGRRDWPFFFRPGDRLARMGDAKPLGLIMSMVKDHKFSDGTVGPAYVLWTPAGKEEAFDADELERTSKLE